MNSEEATGRRIALIVGVVSLFASLTMNLLIVLVYSAPFGWSDIVRLALTLLLIFFLVRGSNVARWIAIVLFGTAGLLGLYYSIQYIELKIAMVFAGFGLVLATCAALLIFPRASRAFYRGANA